MHPDRQLQYTYVVISLPGASLRVKYFWQSDPIMKNIPGKT